MSYIPPSDVAVATSVSSAPFAAIEHMLRVAIQSGDFIFRDHIIKAWVARLSLHAYCPDRLSAVRTVIFADRVGLPNLLGPACLAYIIETPLSSDIWPTGAVVSTFHDDPDIPLTDRQRVRLLLGYYAIQNKWVQLRSVAHNPAKCSSSCLASWLFQWSLTDRRFSGQANMVIRVKKLRDDLLSTGSGAMSQFMTSSCRNAALMELDVMLVGIEAGAPFLYI